MLVVRQQARKFGTVERQRRNHASNMANRGRYRNLQNLAPTPAHIEHVVTVPKTGSTVSEMHTSGGLHTSTLPKSISTSRSDGSTRLVYGEAGDPVNECSSSRLVGKQKLHQTTYRGWIKHPIISRETSDHSNDGWNEGSGDFSRVYGHYESQYQPQISPQTILGAGRVDPFQSFPLETQGYMHNLIDHCKGPPLFFPLLPTS